MTQILSKLTKTTRKSLRKLIKLVNKDGGKLVFFNHRHTSFILFSFSHSLALHDKGFYDAGRWIYEWGSEATRCLECQMRQKEGCSMSICMSYQIRFIDLITSLSVDDEPKPEASSVISCLRMWCRQSASVLAECDGICAIFIWRLPLQASLISRKNSTRKRNLFAIDVREAVIDWNDFHFAVPRVSVSDKNCELSFLWKLKFNRNWINHWFFSCFASANGSKNFDLR